MHNVYLFHALPVHLKLARISSSLFIRNKRETKSYAEIAESVGVDRPSEVLFLTDVFQEAVAAKAAGNEMPMVYPTAHLTLDSRHWQSSPLP